MRHEGAVLALALALAWGRPVAAASAIATVAPEIVRGLGALPPNVLVVAAPLRTDLPAPRGDELAVRVAQILAGKMGGTARPHPKTESLAAARAVASKTGALVFVTTEISGGDLRATVDVFPPTSNAWDRIRIGPPAPTAHAFARAPIDAEVRAFLTPTLLERAQLHKAEHAEGEVLAAACGDLDGDGGMEVALVSRARVAVGRVVAGRFAPGKSAAWSALARPAATSSQARNAPVLLARAPVPLREPLAGAAFRAPGELLVGTTDRGGVRLDANLAPVRALFGIPVPLSGGNGCAVVSPAESAFEGDISVCEGAVRDLPIIAQPLAKRFDAFAQAEVAQRDGTARVITATREPGGKLYLKWGDQTATVEGAGAQVAVGDVDEDGVPEVVTTAESDDDAIDVSSWTPAGLRARAKLPAPGGVRALAVCPPEARGVPALIAVVGGEVWIWR